MRVKTFSYMGSKASVGEWLMGCLPPSESFVDLFFGSGACTVAAMMSGKYSSFVGNDLSDSVVLFRDAVAGRYEGEDRWISREDFFRLKDTDPYVRIIWSFSGRGATYLYGEGVEPFKRACHEFLFGNDYEPLLAMGVDLREYAAMPLTERKYNIMKSAIRQQLGERQQLESYERQVSLERLFALNGLMRLKRYPSLDLRQGDYRDVSVDNPDRALFYADPPYKGCEKYNGKDFDSDAFWRWARAFPYLLCVSEYAAPDDFVCVGKKTHRGSMSSHNNDDVMVDKVFCHKSKIDAYKSRMPKTLF
jgi:hypothetical protein